MDKLQGSKRATLSIFISYAHEDESLCHQLEIHLSLLRRQGWIADWHDRQILPGAEWGKEIDKHLEAAQLVLLLISPDFLASDYCYDVEMQRALERHRQGEVRVIPIILRSCDWQSSPFAHLQCVPHDGKAVSTWQNPDEAFLAITRGLRRVIKQQQIPVRPLPELEQQSRQRLLKQIRRTWIEGVLEMSLHQAALIILDLQEQSDALANPWHLEVQETNRSPRPLPTGTSIVQVFDETDGELLILGEPGAGKTTLLLELARTLLGRAEQEEQARLPVVFILSSWTQRRQPLAEWLMRELSTKYRVPLEIAQNWIDTDQILPLLDGLDEVEENTRAECVQTINTYHQHCLLEKGIAPLVICCRSQDYMALSTRVTLQQAVSIQPLTDEHIEYYLRSARGQLENLRQALHTDRELYELAHRPLMLSIFTLAYQNTTSDDFPIEGTSETQQQVFAAYVRRMLRHRGTLRNNSPERLLRMLTFLAARMHRHAETIFYLEDLHPNWFETPCQRHLYRFSLVLVGALLGALLGGLFNMLGIVIGGRFNTLVNGLDRTQLGMLDVAVGAMLGILVAYVLDVMYSHIKVEGNVTWSWKWSWKPTRLRLRVRIFGMSVGDGGLLGRWTRWSLGGLLGGLLGALVGALSWRLFLGTINILPIMLFYVLLGASYSGLSVHPSEEQMRLVPNQRVWLSARNGLLVGLLSGLFFGLVVWRLSVLYDGRLPLGLMVGLPLGLLVGLLSGLYAFLRHFFIRFLFWKADGIPWKLIPLLDEASDRLLLRKVGGGYIFVHRLLLDYFASLEKKEP